jgi:hypothetical protein
MTTMNNRLDANDRRIARTEKFQQGDQDDEKVQDDGLHSPKRTHGRRRSGGGGDGGSSGNDSDVGDGFRRGRHGLCNDGESDPLPWINKCEHFFQGYRTMEEEKVWTAMLHLDGVAAEWYF